MPLDSDCIFCRIIAGSAPSIKIAEDEQCIAFMDIAPLSQGHCLVVPKSHYRKLHELSPNMMDALGRMLIKITSAMGVDDYNILQNNGSLAYQAVPHVHFHIIPARPEAQTGTGLEVSKQWRTQNISQESLIAQAESIKSRMRCSVVPEMQSIDT
ncbi:succinate dehydrogenase [Perkinsela sp. CCAP 1560/4]|nr:succinate dehydrogenase [Perkinsela sp. CCAP 1560/4]|eukprot:KNH05403.1 succinate dehydrogenase [Perkinsela sp. CCAP 1560/4]